MHGALQPGDCARGKGEITSDKGAVNVGGDGRNRCHEWLCAHPRTVSLASRVESHDLWFGPFGYGLE